MYNTNPQKPLFLHCSENGPKKYESRKLWTAARNDALGRTRVCQKQMHQLGLMFKSPGSQDLSRIVPVDFLQKSIKFIRGA